MRSKVFVSYSRSDKEYLKELRAHLSQHIEDTDLVLWDDARFGVGENWKIELESTLREVFAVILLLSTEFLSPKNGQQNELPAYLEKGGRMGIVLAIITDCDFDAANSKFTLANSLNAPLNKMESIGRHVFWSKLASDITKHGSTEQYEVPETRGLIHAIMSKHPELSEKEAKEIYSLLMGEVAKRIGSGDTLASVRMNDDLEPEITPINIDKLQ